jgi:hypothetical protein
MYVVYLSLWVHVHVTRKVDPKKKRNNLKAHEFFASSTTPDPYPDRDSDTAAHAHAHAHVYVHAHAHLEEFAVPPPNRPSCRRNNPQVVQGARDLVRV